MGQKLTENTLMQVLMRLQELTGVSSHMEFQSRFFSESFVTKSAGVGTFSCESFHMTVKRRYPCKSSGANVTGVRSFICVSSNVIFKCRTS